MTTAAEIIRQSLKRSPRTRDDAQQESGLSRRFATVLHQLERAGRVSWTPEGFSDNARQALEYRADFPLADRLEVAAVLQLTPEQYVEVEIELYACGIWGVMATSDGPALIWARPR